MVLSDVFTEEYYDLVNNISGNTKTMENQPYLGGNLPTFREKQGKSVYESIAIEIVPESCCQLNCQWCYISDIQENTPQKPADLSNIIDIIDQASQREPKGEKKLFGQVVFIGGEPTLHPDLPEMLEHARHNNLFPILVTNGIKLADHAFAAKILIPPIAVVIHLPFIGSNGTQVLNRAVKYKGYSQILHRAINNLLLAREILGGGIEIIGELVLSTISLPFVLDTHIFCRRNRIEPFFERIRLADDRQSNESIMPPIDRVADLLKKIYDYDLEMKADPLINSQDRPHYFRARYLIPPTFNSPCTMPQTGIHIKYDDEGFGRVISCCGQNISHGNICRDGLWRVLENKAGSGIFTRSQRAYIEGPCSQCQLYSLVGCEGGCRGNAFRTFGCARASAPDCVFIKPEIRTNSKIMSPKKCSDCPLQSNDLCLRNQGPLRVKRVYMGSDTK